MLSLFRSPLIVQKKILFPCTLENLFFQKCFLSSTGYLFVMVNFYQCKKCQTKFTAPEKIKDESGRITYVCPRCKNRKWGPLDW